MERILIFIKHHISLLWRIIELGNEIFFSLVYKSRMEMVLPGVFKEFAVPPFSYRRLKESDINPLYDLIRSQSSSDLNYFHPHEFDITSIGKQLRNSSFLMMGAYKGETIVGYFFLRFFANKKCFVGRLIDLKFRGQGIGKVMNSIMYETAWRMNFRCLSTICKNNTPVMLAHSRNPNLVVIKELQNDFLLVEFIRETQGKENNVNSSMQSDRFSIINE